jgi:hypothetical protein
MKILNYIKQNRLAFWISIVYLALGGVVTYALYPSDPFYNDYFFIEWLLTLPVNIISFTYRFTATESNCIVVIIIQMIMFIPTFIIISRLMAKRNKNKIT